MATELIVAYLKTISEHHRAGIYRLWIYDCYDNLELELQGDVYTWKHVISRRGLGRSIFLNIDFRVISRMLPKVSHLSLTTRHWLDKVHDYNLQPGDFPELLALCVHSTNNDMIERYVYTHPTLRRLEYMADWKPTRVPENIRHVFWYQLVFDEVSLTIEEQLAMYLGNTKRDSIRYDGLEVIAKDFDLGSCKNQAEFDAMRITSKAEVDRVIPKFLN